MNKQDLIIYTTADGKASIALYARDGNVWLNQNQLGELFSTSKSNVSMHISNILKERELEDNSVVKDFLTTASDGKNYSVRFYALPMILAIGFRVRSARGTQFRQWANRHLHEYVVKGFVMDDERLKNPDGRPDYFDGMLERMTTCQFDEWCAKDAVEPIGEEKTRVILGMIGMILAKFAGANLTERDFTPWVKIDEGDLTQDSLRTTHE